MENYRERRLEGQLKTQQTISVVVIILLLLSIGGNVFLFLRNNNVNQEKNELINQNSLMAADMRASEESNSQLRSEITELNAQINRVSESALALEEEIKVRDSRIAGLRNQLAEIERLRNQLAGLDSLKAEVAALEGEKETLLSQLQEINQKLTSLRGENQLLLARQEDAAYLKAYNICIHNLRDRWLGRPVEMELARRVNRTMISFEINGNLFIDPGQKNIYIVVKDPDGDIVNPSSETFAIADTGRSVQFTEYTSIQYNQMSVPMSFTISHDDRLDSGNYEVQVYIDGVLAGGKQFSLN